MKTMNLEMSKFRFARCSGLTIPATVWLLLFRAAASVDAASTIQFAAPTYQVSENAGKVTLQILRTNDVQTAVSVDLGTSDGTAQATVDYAATNRNLVFEAGITNLSVEISILNDAALESIKSFNVSLTNITGDAVLGAPAVAWVIIADNDLPVQVEFLAYQAGEADGAVTIAITRGDDGNQPISVDYTTASQGATPGLDYLDVAGSLTFAPGETVKLVPVVILNDGLKEPREYFRFMVTNISGGTLSARRTATVTLIDNDSGIEFTASKYWVHEFEGEMKVTVRRGNDQALDAFTVDYATTNGTATEGLDYVLTRGSLHFPTGVMTCSFSVPILMDDALESTNETFQIVLSNPSGPVGLGSAASLLVTICDSTERGPNALDIRVEPGGLVQLTSLRKPYGTFSNFFELHPLESSSDLVQWRPAALWRQAFTPVSDRFYIDERGETESGARFYRTPAERLFTVFAADLGPYTVGSVDRLLTDPSRRNRYNMSTNGSFAVSIWYPGTPLPGRIPRRWVPEPVARDVSPSGSFYNWTTGWMDRLPYLYSLSFEGLPFGDLPGRCPVIIYSPGGAGPRCQATEIAEHLASRGFVVLAPDHFDAYNTVWPDGYYHSSADNKEISAANLSDRIRDISFIIDILSEWQQTDPLFAGKMDLTKLGVMGMSWGGATAGEFGRLDPRCLAVALLDPGGAAPNITSFSKPSLTMTSSGSTDSMVFTASKTNAVAFSLSDTDHSSMGWTYAFSAYSLESNREVARTLKAYSLSFWNKHLLGEDDGLLSSPPDTNRFPRVREFRRK